MRAALAVNRVGPDPQENLNRIKKMIVDAADKDVDLLVFPEVAMTGLINNDNPRHDMIFAQPIPGAITNIFSLLSKQHKMFIEIGLFELEDGSIYDSALLFNKNGDIILKYRRNSSGWHSKDADSQVYRQGTSISKVDTEYGTIIILICGDLFDDKINEKVKEAKPDWLLFPFARSFNNDNGGYEYWDRVEVPEYINYAKKIGATALMVNYLADSEWNSDLSFGGAMVISPTGKIISELPIGREELLIIDLENTN